MTFGVQKRMLETANNIYRPLAEAQEVYIRTSDALKSLGYNTEQALDVSDSLSYLFVTNAASGERATHAINSFSKAIATGKIEVDTWQSILVLSQSHPSIISDALICRPHIRGISEMTKAVQADAALAAIERLAERSGDLGENGWQTAEEMSAATKHTHRIEESMRTAALCGFVELAKFEHLVFKFKVFIGVSEKNRGSGGWLLLSAWKMVLPGRRPRELFADGRLLSEKINTSDFSLYKQF